MLQRKAGFSPEIIQQATLAKALAHPARIAILKILAGRAECICGEIVDELPLAQATVSQHLKELLKAGLIQGTIDGPRSCYCLNPLGIKALYTQFAGLAQELEQGIPKQKCC
jgi:ArsR family transcriptional regulator